MKKKNIFTTELMKNFLKANRNAPEWKSGNYFNY